MDNLEGGTLRTNSYMGERLEKIIERALEEEGLITSLGVRSTL